MLLLLLENEEREQSLRGCRWDLPWEMGLWLWNFASQQWENCSVAPLKSLFQEDSH